MTCAFESDPLIAIQLPSLEKTMFLHDSVFNSLDSMGLFPNG